MLWQHLYEPTRSGGRAGLIVAAVCAVAFSPGCSSVTCGDAACGPPITVNASIARPGAGPLQVTFCKGAACESVHFDPLAPGVPEPTGALDFRVGATSVTDAGGVGLVVIVFRAPTLVDGEPLRLTVTNAEGAQVLEWSAPARYHSGIINGGCDTCTTMQVEVSG